jgi:NitT/TauT family transport system substrate-binding protein
VEPRVISQTSTINLFLRGGVDVASAMWYNEYHLLLNAGLDPEELTVFHYDDFGLNFPEDGIYCLRATLAADPELCRRFAAASVAGWRLAFRRPAETLDVVMRHVTQANLPTNRVHQKWMLDRMRDVILPEGDGTDIGGLAEDEYRRASELLRLSGVIGTVPEWGEFHERCVIPAEAVGTGP